MADQSQMGLAVEQLTAFEAGILRSWELALPEPPKFILIYDIYALNQLIATQAQLLASAAIALRAYGKLVISEVTTIGTKGLCESFES